MQEQTIKQISSTVYYGEKKSLEPSSEHYLFQKMQLGNLNPIVDIMHFYQQK